jgi:hypothetical protein
LSDKNSEKRSFSEVEKNKLRVILELAFRDVSWTDLRVTTKVGKNPLTKALDTLRGEGAIEESLRRERGLTGRPVIVYHLEPKAKKHYDWLIKSTKDLFEIRTMFEDYATRFSRRSAVMRDVDLPISRKEIGSQLVFFCETIMMATRAIVETELARDHTNPERDNFLTSVYYEIVSDIIQDSKRTLPLTKETIDEIKTDRDNILKMLRRRINELN